MNNPNPLPPTENLIQKELEEMETEAAKLIQWLTDHPSSNLEDKAEVRRRLNEILQAINDLVCKLKPGKVYMLR